MLRKGFMKDHVFSSLEHCQGPRECERQRMEVGSHGSYGAGPSDPQEQTSFLMDELFK